jgi:hypothetical protein
VTFKDLQKLVQSYRVAEEEQTKLFQRLKDKPFWIWDNEKHKLEGMKK